MRIYPAAVVASLLIGVSASAAHADNPLVPLQSYDPIPNVGFFGGSLVQQQTSPFAATSGTQTISGSLISAVYDPDSNPLTQGYDFYYQIALDGVSTSRIDQVNIFGFLNAAIYDSGEIVGSSFGPFSSSTVDGTILSRSTTGGSVRIQFAGPSTASDFAPGDASAIFAFRVSNGTFSPDGNASVTGINGVAANTSGIVWTPVSAAATAPEPASIALLALGAMVGLLRRRK